MKYLSKFSLIFLYLIFAEVLLMFIIAIFSPVVIDTFQRLGVPEWRLPILIQLLRSFDIFKAVILITILVLVSALISHVLTIVNKVLSVFFLIIITGILVVFTIGLTYFEYYLVVA